MTDLYSKAMLSVIALALSALVVQDFTKSAVANSHVLDCFDPENPCLISIVGFRINSGLPVEVTNFPSGTRAYVTGQENPLEVKIVK